MSPIIPNDYSNQAPSRIEVFIDGRPNIFVVHKIFMNILNHGKLSEIFPMIIGSSSLNPCPIKVSGGGRPRDPPPQPCSQLLIVHPGNFLFVMLPPMELSRKL